MKIWRSGLSAARRVTRRQTPCLATMARNCDQIATTPGVTDEDRSPTWRTDTAVEQDQRGCDGIRRTGGDGWWLTTDLAVGGSNPSRRATKPAGQWPWDGITDLYGLAELRPNCDPVGGHS
jgi:hypothetical protein